MTRTGTWLAALRRYLAVIAAGSLVWETAQLPLYVIWRDGSLRTIAFAVLHCTAGDMMIGTFALVAALAVFGSENWPRDCFGAVMAAVIVIAGGYTIWSEYLNTTLRGSWAYSAAMPVLPWLGTGLAPLAQWIAVPALALATVRKGTAHA